MTGILNIQQKVEINAKAPRVAKQDHTVTFYVDSVQPQGLPPFPYIVNGMAAGRVRMVAYLPAESATDAGTGITVYFPGAYVECVEVGRQEPEAPAFQGVAVREKRPGLWARIVDFFS